jgi:prevent-host-death family protein
MQTIQVADLKARFSDILKRVQNEGEEYIIQYGRKHQKVAVLIPYKTYVNAGNKIKLGILDGKAEYEIKEDFEVSDTEFLGLK